MSYEYALALGALSVAGGAFTLPEAVAEHLRHNVYPPVPVEVVPVCVEAIHHMAGGEPEAMVRLPDGLRYRGRSVATSTAIVDGFRLGGLVDGLLSATEEPPEW